VGGTTFGYAGTDKFFCADKLKTVTLRDKMPDYRNPHVLRKNMFNWVNRFFITFDGISPVPNVSWALAEK